MEKNKITELVTSHYSFFRFLSKIYNMVHFRNKLHTKGVQFSSGISLFNGLKIQNHGTDNEITIGDFVRFQNCTITIHGSHNRISIGDFSYLNQIELHLEDDRNEIMIGNHSHLYGPSQFAALEGTKIQIGNDCLFSSNVHFRTCDSHSILNMDGKRINPSKDIIIDDHVWVGTKVTCLKGVHVSENSVVAATTTLCKDYDQKNVIIGGVPGKIIKTGVNWDTRRIKLED